MPDHRTRASQAKPPMPEAQWATPRRKRTLVPLSVRLTCPAARVQRAQTGPTLEGGEGRQDRREVLSVLSCGYDLPRSSSTKRVDDRGCRAGAAAGTGCGRRTPADRRQQRRGTLDPRRRRRSTSSRSWACTRSLSARCCRPRSPRRSPRSSPRGGRACRSVCCVPAPADESATLDASLGLGLLEGGMTTGVGWG